MQLLGITELPEFLGIKAWREGLKKVVEDAVGRKEALLSAHEEMLDDVDTFAGNSVQLVMNTLDISTQAEVLQMKKVFIDGLGHFKQQGEVSLDNCCGGLDIDVNFDAAFDDAFGDMLTGLDDFGLVGVTLRDFTRRVTLKRKGKLLCFWNKYLQLI